MTMQQVLYALEVARTGSVSGAAGRMFISQSALSQQLKRLEEELGYPLFDRTAQGLRLTQKGEEFRAQAAPVAEQWQALCARVEAGKRTQTRPLRLGLGSRVYSNGLFAEIMTFLKAHPRLEVTFVTEAGRDVVEALRRGELDLALDRLPLGEEPAEGASYLATPLIRERQCLLLAPEDGRASLPSISLESLQGETVVTGLENSAEDQSLRSLCRAHGLRLGRVYRSDGIETTMRLVRDGTGVTFGPRSFGDYFHVAAVPIEPETWDALYFICMRSSLKKPEIRQFQEFLTKS